MSAPTVRTGRCIVCGTDAYGHVDEPSPHRPAGFRGRREWRCRDKRACGVRRDAKRARPRMVENLTGGAS